MNNYRPISLLSVVSKILERLMHTRLYSFIDSQEAFYSHQFGFRPNHSTEQAAAVLVDKVTEGLNNNRKIASVFLDMSKAFDCVDYDILLGKLYEYGIRGVAHSWFQSYLRGRLQKVFFNGFLSRNTCKIECGVPQGSILGPLLYLIYVNDCFRSLDHSCSILYADDTTLVFSAESYSSLFKIINHDLKNLNDWLCINKLCINVDKTKYMIFSSNARTIQPANTLKVEINGNEIERVENYKFLGFTMNEHLNWKGHMLNILSKIQRNLGVVRKIACFLNKSSLFQLYHSLIISHIRTGIVVWYHSHIALRKKIQACANKFLRIIFHLKPRDSVRTLMKENNLPSVNQIFHFEIAKLMQKNSLSTIPSPIKDIFNHQVRAANIRTRSNVSINPGLFRTKKFEQSIRFTGPKVWNELPNELRFFSNSSPNSRNIPLPFFVFRQKMKSFVLTNVAFI